VLIIDDNAVNRRILEAQTRSWRMQPTVVDGGAAAIDMLAAAARERRPFGLVLLDANMPDLDGFAVAAQVQLRPDLAGSTIMMLSSSGLAGDVARCRSLGIAGYLTKPIKASDLLDAICRTLDRPAPAIAVPISASLAPPPAPLPAPTDRPIRILVAEDNVVNQRVALGLLKRRGHDVVIVGNGREAVEAVQGGTFDLVLMDVQMPEMGGLEATAAIRERERQSGGHVRIVAMTAHAMNGDRERCVAAGMDGYLSKPLDPRMLFAIVEDPSEPPASAVSSSAVDLFLDECPNRLKALKLAVDARHAEGIRAEAQKLKGAAGTLSATGLFDAAEVLERIGTESRLDAAEAAWRRLSAEASQVLAALRQYETHI